MGRLGSGIWVSASFQIILRPVCRLGLGSEPHVVGRLGSGPRVGGLSPGVFSVGGCLRGVVSRGGYLLESTITLPISLLCSSILYRFELFYAEEEY